MYKFSSVEKAIQDLTQGKIVIVVDDESRENEGDFICAAQFATPENINFMATYGKGLICMPLSDEWAKNLHLDLMPGCGDSHLTAFAHSVDHMSVATGISAYERSVTLTKLADPNAKLCEFRRPGHIFPLIAKKGGVLKRAGHTEATVDLMNLAGLNPVGVCCEILAEDGTMMNGKQLEEFAEKFDLAFISVAQIQEYRKQNELLIKQISVVQMPTKYGKFVAHSFEEVLTGKEHVALVKGEIKGKQNVLCRIHSECLTGDVFGSQRCDCGEQFAMAMQSLEENGQGIVLYLRQEGRGIGLINKLKAYELQDKGMDTLEANLALGFKGDEREYFVAAHMLKILGVDSVRLMTNNPAKIEGLEHFGINVVRETHQAKPNENNLEYLKVKQEKMSHMLEDL